MKSKPLLISLIVFLLLAQMTSAYTLDSSGVSPDKIFKCQPATITANFTGVITSVDVLINNTHLVMINGTRTDYQARFTMSDNGGGQWSYVYGNDGGIIWGNKSISFEVTVGAVTTTNTTDDYVFVYSDACTGTGMSSYQNLSLGLGNYTNRFYTGEVNLLEFALYPWVEYWGYIFYILVIFWISVIVYMKNQLIIQPFLILCVSLGALVTTTWLPDDFKQFVVLLLALALGSIFYKIFRS